MMVPINRIENSAYNTFMQVAQHMIDDAKTKIHTYLQEKYGQHGMLTTPRLITHKYTYYGVYRDTGSGSTLIYYDFRTRQVVERPLED